MSKVATAMNAQTVVSTMTTPATRAEADSFSNRQGCPDTGLSMCQCTTKQEITDTQKLVKSIDSSQKGWQQTLKQACCQGYPDSAKYVRSSIGSRNSAIHNVYHTSLRPSSLLEPRHPSLKVVVAQITFNAQKM